MNTGEVLSLAAILISLGALMLNSRKETRTSAAQIARIEEKLDRVVDDVREIRTEWQTTRDALNDFSARLVKVEARAASNTHRIDKLEMEYSGKKQGVPLPRVGWGCARDRGEGDPV